MSTPATCSTPPPWPASAASKSRPVPTDTNSHPTGNVEQPVRGWTDWQPLNNGVVASPAGRFLQWKAAHPAAKWAAWASTTCP